MKTSDGGEMSERGDATDVKDDRYEPPSHYSLDKDDVCKMNRIYRNGADYVSDLTTSSRERFADLGYENPMFLASSRSGLLISSIAL